LKDVTDITLKASHLRPASPCEQHQHI